MILTGVKFLVSAPNKEHWPQDEIKEIVILGRSNVGKSTFINRMTNVRNLAKVSSTPGRTRLLNFFMVQDRYRLVDAPGYGYAGVSHSADENFGKMMEEYFDDRKNLVGALFLLDSRRVPNADDRLLLNLLIEHHLRFVIIATKCDKLNQSERSQINKNILGTLNLPMTTPIIYSYINKDAWMDQVNERIEDLIK